MSIQDLNISLPASVPKATFARLYSELALNQAALRLYTRPLDAKRACPLRGAW